MFDFFIDFCYNSKLGFVIKGFGIDESWFDGCEFVEGFCKEELVGWVFWKLVYVVGNVVFDSVV